MKIVFMGTPDFAVPCLKRLQADGHELAAVYSQPDRPAGRGMKLAAPPVKAAAQERGIPVYQPTKLRDGTVAAQLQELAPDLMAVVAYGRILPPEILAIPPGGCINIHGSLLPKWRGAAPIQWAVIHGDTVTGVTSQFMAEGMDTGDIILQRETPIGAEETSGELFDRLAILGADCLSETLDALAAGKAPRIPQDSDKATYAPPIEKDMAWLDFNKSPTEICNLIRGLNPSPVAKTTLAGKLLRVLKARPAEGFAGKPGELLDRKRFLVACGDGAVEFLLVQPEGKKRMDGEACIRGVRLQGGESCFRSS
jgi:methionyl-tRNA formyltransferase